MSLNLSKVGSPLAKIVGGKYNGHVVSVSDQTNNEGDATKLIQEFKQLKISNDSNFQILPNYTRERDILYITGPSGSGKSTFTRMYLQE